MSDNPDKNPAAPTPIGVNAGATPETDEDAVACNYGLMHVSLPVAEANAKLAESAEYGSQSRRDFQGAHLKLLNCQAQLTALTAAAERVVKAWRDPAPDSGPLVEWRHATAGLATLLAAPTASGKEGK